MWTDLLVFVFILQNGILTFILQACDILKSDSFNKMKFDNMTNVEDFADDDNADDDDSDYAEDDDGPADIDDDD